jgi:ribosome maturation factor RimP
MDLTDAAKEVLEPLGFEVLELSVSGKGAKRVLLLRIDRMDGKTVSIEDVSLASEVFGLELDRLDPFEGAYRLEVESPGPERPLKTAAHFRRFHDLLAKVRTGGETFRGRIHDVGDEAVAFEVEGELRQVALKDIDKAWLAEWPKEPR